MASAALANGGGRRRTVFYIGSLPRDARLYKNKTRRGRGWPDAQAGVFMSFHVCFSRLRGHGRLLSLFFSFPRRFSPSAEPSPNEAVSPKKTRAGFGRRRLVGGRRGPLRWPSLVFAGAAGLGANPPPLGPCSPAPVAANSATWSSRCFSAPRQIKDSGGNRPPGHGPAKSPNANRRPLDSSSPPPSSLPLFASYSG